MTSRSQFRLGIAGGKNLRAAAHPPECGGGFEAQFPSLGCDQIGNLMVLEISPHILNRIEFGRIGRQPLHQQSPSGPGDILFNQPTAVNRCAIPQNQYFSADMALQVMQELKDLEAFDAARMNLKVEAPLRQAANDREAFPVEGLLQHRRLSAPRPSPRPRGTRAQSAFVDEDDGSPLLAGLFFKAGQITRFQRRMAGSLRSTARRSGRWQLKPLAPSKRQTWPG